MTLSTPTLPTELPEAVTAQIAETRFRLRTDAAATGASDAEIDEALARAVEHYRDARVHAFIGILVERDVRESLGLRRSDVALDVWG
jgi:hypothetical protein